MMMRDPSVKLYRSSNLAWSDNQAFERIASDNLSFAMEYWLVGSVLGKSSSRRITAPGDSTTTFAQTQTWALECGGSSDWLASSLVPVDSF